jgi:glycosyltransferase involved in cell wall biosynthesis
MFSVVIPLYNKAAFIARTIERVQAQTWSDFEVLIVDDGSTDGSGSVAGQAMAGDARFRCERVSNGGVSVARNHGARRTGRPWLVFLDADDEWRPEFLQEVARVALARPEAALISTNYFVRRAGEEVPLAVPPGDFSKGVPFFDWALSIGPPIWTSATAVNRKHFEAVHGFEESMTSGEDIHLWVRLLQCGEHFFLHHPLAVYDRGDPDSLSRSLNDKAMASRRLLMRFLAEREQTGEVPRPYVQAVYTIYFVELLKSGRYREAASLAMSARHLPLRSGVVHALRHIRDRARRFQPVLPS